MKDEFPNVSRWEQRRRVLIVRLHHTEAQNDDEEEVIWNHGTEEMYQQLKGELGFGIAVKASGKSFKGKLFK